MTLGPFQVQTRHVIEVLSSSPDTGLLRRGILINDHVLVVFSASDSILFLRERSQWIVGVERIATSSYSVIHTRVKTIQIPEGQYH